MAETESQATYYEAPGMVDGGFYIPRAELAGTWTPKKPVETKSTDNNPEMADEARKEAYASYESSSDDMPLHVPGYN